MAFTNKPIALITGANRGIGFSLARALSRDYSFHILLGCRTAESGAPSVSQLQSEGLSVEALPIDLTSDASIIGAAKAVEQKYGKLDVLVNNAGVLLEAMGSETKEGVDEIAKLRKAFSVTYSTNVCGTVAVTAAFIPLLSKSTLPRILFLSSTLGSISDRSNPQSIYDNVDLLAYRSSKAALNMVAASYARKYWEKGWKINIACPGSVATGLNGNIGKLTTEDCLPGLVRLCVLGEDGENGTFSDAEGVVAW